MKKGEKTCSARRHDAKEGSFAKTWRYIIPTPESSDGEESFVVELLFGVLVAMTAFGLDVFLWRLGIGVEVDRGFSFQAGRVIVALTTVSSRVGRRTGVTAPLRR